MTAPNIPILTSFYAVVGEKLTLIFGQIEFTSVKDFSFKDYSKTKTLRTLFALYRTKPFAHQDVVLTFNTGDLRVKTDAYGSFTIHAPVDTADTYLQKVEAATGGEVKILSDLYPINFMPVTADTIVISDIDDTLIHSFIRTKAKKVRTLLFTTVEKRKAVANMNSLLQKLNEKGAAIFYLSNSEQNLYPLIYRFLLLNNFPPGPLFLKKMRGLWQVIRNIKFPKRTLHKEQIIAAITKLFPSKKLILIGDNTQEDLHIYLKAVENFPAHIQTIVVLKVIDKDTDAQIIHRFSDKIKANNVRLLYSSKVPSVFELNI